MQKRRIRTGLFFLMMVLLFVLTGCSSNSSDSQGKAKILMSVSDASDTFRASLAKAAKEADSKLEVRHFADRESLMAELPKLLQDGDQILVKASHFMEYGKIVEMLETAQKL